MVFTKKLMFDETYEKICLAGSHFSTHGYAIDLFVVVTTEWKVIECKYVDRKSVWGPGDLRHWEWQYKEM